MKLKSWCLQVYFGQQFMFPIVTRIAVVKEMSHIKLLCTKTCMDLYGCHAVQLSLLPTGLCRIVRRITISLTKSKATENPKEMLDKHVAWPLKRIAGTHWCLSIALPFAVSDKARSVLMGSRN